MAVSPGAARFAVASDAPRTAKMTVDLGEQVALERAHIVEEMGDDFEMTLDILAAHAPLNLLPQMGKPVGVAVSEHGQHARYFHGLLVAGELLSEELGAFRYRLVAKPFTHFLDHNQDMAIFQNQTVPDIIKKVLSNAGITAAHLDFKLTGTYPKREYCVQYRESDLTFITRLMEEEGIYYYWRHDATQHVMTFRDAPTGHQPGKPEDLTFNPHADDNAFATGEKYGTTKRFASRFHERVQSGAEALVTFRDFDLTKADSPLESTASAAHKHAGSEREFYDYPAGFTEKARGEQLCAIELDELRRDRELYEGRSHAIGLAIGTTVTLYKLPIPRLNKTYLITRTEHVIENEGYHSLAADAEVDPDEYTHVVFHAIPALTRYRLLEETPKPLVQGLETAIVDGPDGEEIHTDEYGRVKVRFHWDRRSVQESANGTATCFIRVAQYGGLGTVTLPRVNQEVMVDFLHGNPDEPIVVGWVFNSTQKPVYKLDDHKSRHVFRGRNYPGGKSKNYAGDGAIEIDTKSPGANEIRLEDKYGEEEVFIHSEKELTIRTRRDRTLQVGRNEVQLIGLDRTDEVKRDETTKIGQNQTLTVEGKQTETIKAERTIDVKDKDKLTVGQSQTIEVGTEIKITANQSITITCGGSKIEIKPQGIVIDAPTIEIKGGGTAKLTSPMTTIEGQGMNIVKGGTVMIN